MKKIITIGVFVVGLIVTLSLFLYFSRRSTVIPRQLSWEKTKPHTSKTEQVVRPDRQAIIQTELGRLKILKGALPEAATISLTSYTEGWADTPDAVAIGVRLEPAGLKFDGPVLLTLELPAPLPPGSLVRVKYKGPNGDEAADELITELVPKDGRQLQLAINYFSEYMISVEDVHKALDSELLYDFSSLKDSQNGGRLYAYFRDFKQSGVLNGDPLLSKFKGMSDDASRKESFKYALRQAVLQIDLANAVDDKWAKRVFDCSDAAFDSLQALSKSSKMADAIQLLANDENFLRFYRDNILKWDKHATLTAAHLRLMKHLTSIQKVSVAAVAGDLAINIGKDMYRVLFIRSLDEELIDQRLAVLRGALETNANVPMEIINWLDEVKAEISRERKDLWAGITRELQEGSMGERVLPLTKLVTRAGPPLSPGWAKVVGKYALPIGVVIEIAETLVKMDDFVQMIGNTTAAATLVRFYLSDSPANTSSASHISPELAQIRTYLLYHCHALYAAAYEGNLIDHAVRWLIGSIQDLAGQVPSWTEDRLQRLRDQKAHFASLCIAAQAEVLAKAQTQFTSRTLVIYTSKFKEYPAAFVSLEDGAVLPVTKDLTRRKEPIAADLWIEPRDPEFTALYLELEDDFPIGVATQLAVLRDVDFETILSVPEELDWQAKLHRSLIAPGTMVIVRSRTGKMYKLLIEYRDKQKVILKFAQLTAPPGDIASTDADQRLYNPQLWLNRVRSILSRIQPTVLLLTSLAKLQAESGDKIGADLTLSEAKAIAPKTTSNPSYYICIAIAQAEIGDLAGAMATARTNIKDCFALQRCEVYCVIAEILAQRNDSFGSDNTYELAKSTAADEKIDPPTRAICYARIAASQNKCGVTNGSAETLRSAKQIAGTIDETEVRHYILVEIDRLINDEVEAATATAVARDTLRLTLHRDRVLFNAAVAQALRGDIPGGKETAARVEDGSCKDLAYGEIAAVQARQGNVAEAKETVSRIERKYYKFDAITAIAASQAKAGEVIDVNTWAESLAEDYFKAQAYLGAAKGLLERQGIQDGAAQHATVPSAITGQYFYQMSEGSESWSSTLDLKESEDSIHGTELLKGRDGGRSVKAKGTILGIRLGNRIVLRSRLEEIGGENREVWIYDLETKDGNLGGFLYDTSESLKEFLAPSPFHGALDKTDLSHRVNFQRIRLGTSASNAKPSEKAEEQALELRPLTYRLEASLAGHRTSVNAIAFSPDSKYIASGGGHVWSDVFRGIEAGDCSLRLWDVAKKKCLRVLSGHSGAVTEIEFSPDGSLIVSGSQDKTIKIWDVASGNCLRTLSGHRGGVSSVAFSPDGSRVASASWDESVKLWDPATGECLRTLTGHRETVCAVAFWRHGRYLISGGLDNTVRLWGVHSGLCIRELAVPDAAEDVAGSPSGQYIAAGCSGLGGVGALKIWDISSGHSRELDAHAELVRTIDFSSDSKWVASGGGFFHSPVKIWDVRTGECVQTLAGHAPNDVAFSPDGRHLACATAGQKTITIWRLER